MLTRGGNAATFAAGVTEISPFGMGGEVPIIVYLADRGEAVVISGQGPAPAASIQQSRRADRSLTALGIAGYTALIHRARREVVRCRRPTGKGVGEGEPD